MTVEKALGSLYVAQSIPDDNSFNIAAESVKSTEAVATQTAQAEGQLAQQQEQHFFGAADLAIRAKQRHDAMALSGSAKLLSNSFSAYKQEMQQAGRDPNAIKAAQEKYEQSQQVFRKSLIGLPKALTKNFINMANGYRESANSLGNYRLEDANTYQSATTIGGAIPGILQSLAVGDPETRNASIAWAHNALNELKASKANSPEVQKLRDSTVTQIENAVTASTIKQPEKQNESYSSLIQDFMDNQVKYDQVSKEAINILDHTGDYNRALLHAVQSPPGKFENAVKAVDQHLAVVNYVRDNHNLSGSLANLKVSGNPIAMNYANKIDTLMKNGKGQAVAFMMNKNLEKDVQEINNAQDPQQREIATQNYNTHLNQTITNYGIDPSSVNTLPDHYHQEAEAVGALYSAGQSLDAFQARHYSELLSNKSQADITGNSPAANVLRMGNFAPKLGGSITNQGFESMASFSARYQQEAKAKAGTVFLQNTDSGLKINSINDVKKRIVNDLGNNSLNSLAKTTGISVGSMLDAMSSQVVHSALGSGLKSAVHDVIDYYKDLEESHPRYTDNITASNKYGSSNIKMSVSKHFLDNDKTLSDFTPNEKLQIFAKALKAQEDRLSLQMDLKPGTPQEEANRLIARAHARDISDGTLSDIGGRLAVERRGQVVYYLKDSDIQRVAEEFRSTKPKNIPKGHYLKYWKESINNFDKTDF